MIEPVETPPAFTPLPALKAWMDDRGLKQCELADMLGVSQAAVSRWLAGRRAMPTAVAGKLAHLTGIPVERLATHPEASQMVKLLGSRPKSFKQTLRNNVKVR